MPDIQLEDGTKLSFQNDPTPADIDFAVQQMKGSQTPNQTQDNTINSRPSAIADLTKNSISIQHPLGAVLRTVQGANELYQGVPASIGLDLQRGRPQDIMGNLGKVVTGQRPAQFGDIYQSAGIPKPIASAAGLATDVALTPGGIEGVQQLGKGVAGIAQGGAKAVGNFFNFDQKALTLSEKVRAVASQAHTNEVSKFGNKVDGLSQANPTRTTNLQDVVNNIKNNPDLPYEAKSVFNKTPILRDMLKDPNTPGYIDPANVSLGDTQQIINYINTKIPRSIKANSLDILDTQNDIRAAQLDAFPEMQQVRADYAQHANDFKLLRSALNPKSTPTAIRTNFNDNPAVKDAASRVLAPILQDMQNYRNQVGTANAIKKAIGLLAKGALITAGGGAIYEGGRKVLGK